MPLRVDAVDLVLHLFRTVDHRPELEHREQPSVLPHARLQKDHRPRGIQPDRQRDRAHHRQHQEREGTADGQIEQSLEQPLDIVERRVAQVDHRQAAKVVHGGAVERQAEIIGHDAHVHRQVVQRRHQMVDPPVRPAGKRHDDVIDLFLVHHPADVVHVAKHRQAVLPLVGIVIEVADQPQSDPVVLAHHVGHPLPHLASAHDQHPAGRVDPAVQHPEIDAGQDAPGQEGGQVQRGKGDEQGAGDLAVAQVQKPGKDQHGKDRRHNDALELVDRFVGAPGVVHGEGQKDAQPDEPNERVQGPGHEHLGRRG